MAVGRLEHQHRERGREHAAPRLALVGARADPRSPRRSRPSAGARGARPSSRAFHALHVSPPAWNAAMRAVPPVVEGERADLDALLAAAGHVELLEGDRPVGALLRHAAEVRAVLRGRAAGLEPLAHGGRGDRVGRGGRVAVRASVLQVREPTLVGLQRREPAVDVRAERRRQFHAHVARREERGHDERACTGRRSRAGIPRA